MNKIREKLLKDLLVQFLSQQKAFVNGVYKVYINYSVSVKHNKTKDIQVTIAMQESDHQSYSGQMLRRLQNAIKKQNASLQIQNAETKLIIKKHKSLQFSDIIAIVKKACKKQSRAQ